MVLSPIPYEETKAQGDYGRQHGSSQCHTVHTVRSTLEYLSFRRVTLEQVIYSDGYAHVCQHLSFRMHFVLTC